MPDKGRLPLQQWTFPLPSQQT